MVRAFEREDGRQAAKIILSEEEKKKMNIGEVVRYNGKVMIFLERYMDGARCLGLDQHNRLQIVYAEGELEPLKYEHLTVFLRNRLLFLNGRFGKAGE